MKKNKTLLGVALLIAVLMLGIGYALSTTTLTVGGTVTVDPEQTNFVVKFTDAQDDNAAANEATIGDGTNATFTVTSLTAVGDTAVATYTVKNNSNVGINAKIAAATVNKETANSEYYTATAKFADGTDVLEVGESATLTVTVKLDKAPVDAAITGKFTVSFTATPEAA